jgi:hypothetical protein
MALDPTRLATTMRTAILSANCGAVDGPALTGLCNALATSIVTEILTHAVVPAGLLAAPPSGGPVTGSTTVT